MLCRGEKYRFCCDLSISTSASDSGAGPTRSTHQATETTASAFWQEEIVPKHQQILKKGKKKNIVLR